MKKHCYKCGWIFDEKLDYCPECEEENFGPPDFGNRKDKQSNDTIRSVVTKKRCFGDTPLYADYHDNEWGRPVHDDKRLFEVLILEVMGNPPFEIKLPHSPPNCGYEVLFNGRFKRLPRKQIKNAVKQTKKDYLETKSKMQQV